MSDERRSEPLTLDRIALFIKEEIEKFQKEVFRILDVLKSELKQNCENYTDAKLELYSKEVDKHQDLCKAFQIFSDDDNVKDFYKTISENKGYLKKEKNYQWIIGLLFGANITLLCKLFKVF
jgi:hypothetical protein